MNIPFSFILLFGISGGEIFVILLLVLVLFGPKKIPEIARTIGKGINEVKRVQRDINNEINRYSEEIDNPVKSVKEDIEGFSKGLSDDAKGVQDAMDRKYNPHYDHDDDVSPPENTAAYQPDEENTTDDGLPYPYNQKNSEESESTADEKNDGQNNEQPQNEEERKDSNK